MTVAEHLGRWRERYPASEADASRAFGVRWFWVQLGPLRVPVPHPGLLHWHDLHHMVVRYPPDLVGEIEISAFELRTGPKTLIVALLCLAAVALGGLIAPVRVAKAWRAARGARNLYGSATSYEDVLQWPLSTLRSWMRLAPTPVVALQELDAAKPP